MPPSRTYSDPDVIAQIADLDAAVAAARRGGDQRPAPQPVPRLQHRVRRVPRVHPRRRPPPARLAGLRPVRPPLHQAIRGREQRPRHVRRRRQRVDELSRARGPRSRKFDYAATLVVSLAMLLARQQDPVGLVLFDEEAGTVLPPERDPGAGHGDVGPARDVHAGPQDRAGRPAPLAHRPDPPPRLAGDRLRPVHRPGRRLRRPEPPALPRPRGAGHAGARPRRARAALRRPDDLPGHRGGRGAVRRARGVPPVVPERDARVPRRRPPASAAPGATTTSGSSPTSRWAIARSASSCTPAQESAEPSVEAGGS